ncbi:FAD-dependent oxidoreductase [Actinomadura flavalba]|uniref:FAD-dependent oxidoreductase n=1 Tax=Actinomadura flavalba TaxID=1120938 RepID=UPI00035DD406|nr:FAD-dependent oxidoreductase [Actinomadura flavalba]
MTERTPVVIVGAGTCGLAAACALRRAGIDVRLLEREDVPGTGSRATLLWPLGLAVLRDLGVREDAERRGLPLDALHYHLAGGRTLRTTVGAENEALVLAQHATDALLEEALEAAGGRVERSAHVSGVTPGPDGVTVKVDRPGGTELIEAQWLIAADGVGSTVRRLLGIDFPGTTLPARYLAVDGAIDGDLAPGAVHYFLRPAGPMVVAPLRGGTVRMGAPVPDGTELSEATVQRVLTERGGDGLVLRRLDDITTFASQERVAATLRHGRCFLVGDAAHTHSPIGGQGLNLGLQDVANLTWKLAGVLRGAYTPDLLDTYEPERRRAAEQTVQNTHRFARMFTLGPRPARVRNAAWRGLDATGVLRRHFVPLLAGRRVAYPDVLPGGPARRARGLPAPGERPPGGAPPAGTGALRLVTRGDAALAAAGAHLAARHPGRIAHEHRASGRGFVLVRPDGFVARAGRTTADLDHVATLAAGLAPAPGGA